MNQMGEDCKYSIRPQKRRSVSVKLRDVRARRAGLRYSPPTRIEKEIYGKPKKVLEGRFQTCIPDPHQIVSSSQYKTKLTIQQYRNT